eukprot:gene5721-14519_t
MLVHHWRRQQRCCMMMPDAAAQMTQLKAMPRHHVQAQAPPRQPPHALRR